MTDNRTTELLCKLRKMLDGCRRTETAGFDTYWITAVALDSSLDELEQAIAATLGSDDEYESKMDALLSRLTNGKWSKSRAYDLDFMVSCVDEEYEDAYEKERAELGGGTLTAEQVRDAIERHVTFYEGGDFDEQAIANELNAKLGSGTCHSTTDSSAWCFVCSECGKSFPRNKLHLAHNHGEINYCPNCGRAVKR